MAIKEVRLAAAGRTMLLQGRTVLPGDGQGDQGRTVLPGDGQGDQGRTVLPGDGQGDAEDGEERVDGQHPRRLRRAAVLQRQRHAQRLKQSRQRRHHVSHVDCAAQPYFSGSGTRSV